MPTAQDKAADPAACGPIVPPSGHSEKKASVAALALGSIGVVYGDIGTSPLYALRESIIHSDRATGLTEHNITGTVSLLLWALFFIVTAKYVLFLMRADNKGEGGTLSLMALAQSSFGRRAAPIFFLGVAGAALFSGDAIITPAISVLSALEGLQVGTPVFSGYVLPLTVVVLISVFAVQRHGTAKVATFFGPVMAIFFIIIALLGAIHIPDAPRVLRAFNPLVGIGFLIDHGFSGFLVLGSVFLAVTGAEALYADMG
ncbi:MAG: KUP/HAK/KT family potassium transporter, partial [Methylovirgula sp.]|nr:KUP/HAK/KT family potassium transporter [Methylovirgula sp.]